MLGKLAFRNVKRQISNYLIYFITVTLAVAMMFSVCNLTFSEELLEHARKLKMLRNGLIFISVFTSVVISFVLGYASSFMLKLRSREFGTYLTLGMKRRNILLMFTAENFLICAVALGTGILLGLVIFQGIMGLVAQLMELEITFASYSLQGLVLTTCLTVAMYILSAAASAIYLKKVSIHELLHAERKVEKSVRHPVVWTVVTVISFITILAGIWQVNAGIRTSIIEDGSTGTGRMFLFLVLMMLGVVFYHIGFSKSAVHLLLKLKKLKCKGANTFILRQLSGQLSTNATLCGMIAFLITGGVLFTNLCFGHKATLKQILDRNIPFDIVADENLKEAPYTYEEAIERIEKYTDIEQIITYDIFTSGNNYLHSFTPWQYDHINDSFIKESDFNRLISALGYDPVSLGSSFLVLVPPSYIHMVDFTNAVLSIYGKQYSLKEASTLYPDFSRTYFLTVVPDEAVSGMTIGTQMAAISLSNDNFDAQALNDELSYKVKSMYGGYLIERSPFMVRAYYEKMEYGFSAILIVGEMYMAIVFIFLAVALLTMKLLSGIAAERIRYNLLYKLGSSRQERKSALFKQTFCIFTVPFLLPVLMNIPAAWTYARIMKLGGYTTVANHAYINAAMIAAVLIVIQFIYFIATYSVQKRNVIY